MAARRAGAQTLNDWHHDIAAQHKRLYTRSHTVIQLLHALIPGPIVSSTSSIGGFSPGQQCLG
ncbi:MAG: hypothetical protein ABI671_05450, partial [Burkholderiales bacterium]